MTTQEVGKKLVELCSKGELEKAAETLYSNSIVSVESEEMPGMGRSVKGMDAVKKKSEWWVANHVTHGVKVQGPFVSVEKFAVVFEFDVTAKQTGKRSTLSEVAVYTVEGGKIVHEEFLGKA